MPILTANAKAIEEGARVLRAGGLVAFPTETVYGLGADATNGKAVARIFEAKGRPRFNPLIAHLADTREAGDLAIMNEMAERLAKAFWPGPLTLVVQKRTDPSVHLSELVTAGLDTIAIRVPAHPIARALLQAAGVPVAAPSANISGKVSATDASHVKEDFGDKVDLILDGGRTPGGVESTIVGLVGEPTLLRAGGLPRLEIEAVLGRPLASAHDGKIQAPGQLVSHYAPKAALRLEASCVRAGEVLLGFGPQAEGATLNLSPSGDLREAAANLFAFLRLLDSASPRVIAVSPIPEDGLGEAINDRLRRAAAPRP